MSSDSSNPFVKLVLFFFDFIPWWLFIGVIFCVLVAIAYEQEQKKNQVEGKESSADEPNIS